MDEEAGFTLIETVCSLAVVGLLAARVLPAIPRATSQARLAGYAIDIAALLKGDRNAAIRSHIAVATTLDADSRTVRSGAGAPPSRFRPMCPSRPCWRSVARTGEPAR